MFAQVRASFSMVSSFSNICLPDAGKSKTWFVCFFFFVKIEINQWMHFATPSKSFMINVSAYLESSVTRS